LYQAPYSSMISDSVLARKYFKDFNHLATEINNAIHIADRQDDNAFAMQITALYLAWYGVRIKDIVNIKKEDVYEGYILVNGKEIHPNQLVMDYIVKYRDAASYDSTARGIIKLKYAPSQYLIRTTRTGSITPATLGVSMRALSSGRSKEDNLLTYEKAYFSGIYSRILTYESINGALRIGKKEEIEAAFGEEFVDVAVANKKLKSYLAFKNYYYGDRG